MSHLVWMAALRQRTPHHLFDLRDSDFTVCGRYTRANGAVVTADVAGDYNSQLCQQCAHPEVTR